MAKGIDKSRVLVNKATSNRNTVVLYRGIDKTGRIALLTAVFAAGKEPTKASKKNDPTGIDIQRLRTVRLQYIRDPKQPDVYKPKKGDF